MTIRTTLNPMKHSVSEPYEAGTVLLFGANTGEKTYVLSKGIYQVCVVGGGLTGSNWTKPSGGYVEVQFRLTTDTIVVVYSGGGRTTAYCIVDGKQLCQATGSMNDGQSGKPSIDTSHPNYYQTIGLAGGIVSNFSIGASVSPYGGWGKGGAAGGARLAYIGKP